MRHQPVPTSVLELDYYEEYTYTLYEGLGIILLWDYISPPYRRLDVTPRQRGQHITQLWAVA